MVWYYIVFFAGGFSGLLMRGRKAEAFVRILMLMTGWILIVIFGIQFTADTVLRDTMASDLIAATILSAAAVFGSVVMTLFFLKGLGHPLNDRANANNPAGFGELSDSESVIVAHRNPLKRNLLLLGPTVLFALGMLIGFQSGFTPSVIMMKGFLFPLIAAAGAQTGMEMNGLKYGKTEFSHHSLILFAGLPVFIIGGTLIFASMAAVFLPFTWYECMLCAVPMGWQTLGGPMVMDFHSMRLGNLTFLVNQFRDMISLVLIPLLCQSRYRILGITPGGVSTMDVLLPVITASTGKTYIIHAMWVGGCCAFWAPVLVWIIAKAVT